MASDPDASIYTTPMKPIKQLLMPLNAVKYKLLGNKNSHDIIQGGF